MDGIGRVVLEGGLNKPEGVRKRGDAHPPTHPNRKGRSVTLPSSLVCSILPARRA
jgi:hypothetical protein